MEIKILGTGCTKCQTLEALTHEAVEELGLTAAFEKVTDPGEIASWGGWQPPPWSSMTPSSSPVGSPPKPTSPPC